MAIVGSSTLSGASVISTEIFNIALGAVDTEQSQVLPTNIVGYLIRTRGNSDLKLSHVSGESGTKYVTIPKKASFTDEHSYTALTLFFQSPSTSDTVEILTWKF